jgi:hypothetical protein
MKRALLLAALLAAPAWMPEAKLQASPIQRCEANGTVVYTDSACRAMGAQAAPMSKELIQGLAREARFAEERGLEYPGSLAVDTAQSEEAQAARAYLAARHGGAGCARSPEQLQLLLRGAVEMGDVNRIATAYHWAGMGNGQAKHVLARLEGLAKLPVTDTSFFDATITSSVVDASMAQMSPVALRGGTNAGYLQLVQNGGTSVTEFEVHRLMGCWFVSF